MGRPSRLPDALSGGESGRPSASRRRGTVLEPGRERNSTCTCMEGKRLHRLVLLGTACRRFPPTSDSKAGYKGSMRAREGCGRPQVRRTSRGSRIWDIRARGAKPAAGSQHGAKIEKAGSNGAGQAEHTASSSLPPDNQNRRFPQHRPGHWPGLSFILHARKGSEIAVPPRYRGWYRCSTTQHMQWLPVLPGSASQLGKRPMRIVAGTAVGFRSESSC